MRNNRKGSMLIQQIILMGAAGGLFLSSATILHRGFNFASDHRRHHAQNLNERRLALQFRQDVHLAHAINLVSSKKIELRHLDQSFITYEIEQTTVRRVHSNGDASLSLATEQFDIFPKVQAEFHANGSECSLKLSGSRSLKEAGNTSVHLLVSGRLLPALARKENSGTVEGASNGN